MRGAGTELANGLATLLYVGLMAVFVLGGYMGGYVVLYNYESQFAALDRADVHNGQLLYNETVARQLKDTLLQQQITALTAELNEEAMARLMDYLLLYYAILNETATRQAEQQNLTWAIANETATREAADSVIAGELAVIEAQLPGLIAYTQYSIQQFMIKMANISHMDTLLINEMAAEQAGYLLLQGQSVLIQQTINYLFMRLAKEVHERTIMYELNKEWLDALSVNVSGVLMAINTQTEINHNLDVVSTNTLTTITTVQGLMTFKANGILTVNSVAADSTTGDLGFSAGSGISLSSPSPNTWQISNPAGPAIDRTPQYQFGLWTIHSGYGCLDGNTNGWYAYNNVPNFWTIGTSGTISLQMTVTLTVNLQNKNQGTSFGLSLMDNSFGIPAAWWSVSDPCVLFKFQDYDVSPIDSVNIGTSELNGPVYLDIVLGYTGIVSAPYVFSPAIFISGGNVQASTMFVELRYARVN